MARPPHVLLEFRGVFGTLTAPVEDWVFGLRHTDSEELSDSQALNDAALACGVAYLNHIAPIMSTNLTLTQTRVARISGGETNGQFGGRVLRRADGSLMQNIYSHNIAGQRPATNAPTQLALVASLETARQGAQGKGRIFLPSPGFIPEAVDRRLTGPDAQTIANGVRDFISALNGSIGFGSIVVASGGGKTTGPVLSPVTAVKVGRAFDTMRSRREGLPESYLRATL